MRQVKSKYPLRKSIVFTSDELLQLISMVGDRHDDLNRFLPRGRKGVKKLAGAVSLLRGIQRKLWAA